MPRAQAPIVQAEWSMLVRTNLGKVSTHTHWCVAIMVQCNMAVRVNTY